MNCKMPFYFKVLIIQLYCTHLFIDHFPWFFVSPARFSPCCTFFQLGHQHIKSRNPSKSGCLQQHPTYHFFPSLEGSSIWTVWSSCWWCLYCCYMEAFFEYCHWKLPESQWSIVRLSQRCLYFSASASLSPCPLLSSTFPILLNLWQWSCW